MAELLPRAAGAWRCWRARYDIGLNIDAEEADRLELSLDLFEALALDPALAGWNGLGFVVQAYQKRCAVRDRLAGRPGAAQRPPADGAAGQGRLLGQPRSSARRSTAWPAIRSSRARSTPTSPTSPARAGCWRRPTRSTRSSPPTTPTRWPPIHAMARQTAVPDYEFQCLHGMGETLYDQVVGAGQAGPALPHLRAGRHARDAAGLSGAPPAGERRQLVVRQPHRRSRRSTIDELVADPVALARAPPVARRIRRIPLPRDCIGASAGIRAASTSPNEHGAARARRGVAARPPWRAAPDARRRGLRRTVDGAVPVRNPADHRDVVGTRRARPTPTMSTRALAGAAAARLGRTDAGRARRDASSARPI